MRKNVNMKIMIPAMIGVLILVIVLKCFGFLTFRSGMRFGFVGNDGIHKMTGSYSKITGTSSHYLKPSDGSTAVRCEITTKSGTLHVVITEGSTVVCDKEISGDETFDVPAKSRVKVTITTSGHSGSYRFEY